MDRIRPLDYLIYHNPVRAWLIALAVLVAGIAFLYVLKHVVVRRFEALARRTTSQVDDLVLELLRTTRFYFILLVTVAAAARVLTLPGRTWTFVYNAAVLALLLQAGVWGNAAIRFLVHRYTEQRIGADPSSVTAVAALGIIARGIVWSVILLMALKTVFGVDVTALVAGLGVTGIAVALAVQSVLGDMLAAVAIVTSKPFVVGESISAGDYTGTVRTVGLRSTRLTSNEGEEIIVPNKKLLDERVKNHSRQVERRVVWPLRLALDTPPATLARVPALIKELVEAQAPVRFERSHLKTIGETAFELETSYVVLTPDYTKHMDIRQTIYLALLERLAAEGVELATPTRTVTVRPGADGSGTLSAGEKAATGA